MEETINVQELLLYIAKNINSSSPFLSPIVEHSVEVMGLLDEIAKLRGISPQENGRDFNEILDSITI